MLFKSIFDERLAQYAYLIGCQECGEALIVDPERDIDRYTRIAEAEGLRITTVAETHIHADFLSGARAFAEEYGTKLYLSDEGGEDWKSEWAKDGRYDVTFLRHGDVFNIGNVRVQAVHTPGHTPEHLSFLVTDVGGGADEPMGMLTGDFIFVGDVGRPDLLDTAAGHQDTMEVSARSLYGSIQRFTDTPEYVQIWPGHGAGSACGKSLGSIPQTTAGYEYRFSPALQAAQSGEEPFLDYILSGQPEPPVYFARMKTLNKEGVPLLGSLPHPRRITAEQLAGLSGRMDVTVLDTRPDRLDFMAAHLPGSLYAPFDKTFPTIAGAYADPQKPVYLIIEEDDVEEAVRNLIRVGLDHIAGYATYGDLASCGDRRGLLRATSVVDFGDVERQRRDVQTGVVDVRRAEEYEAGHIPGALHLPHTRLPALLDELPRDQKLLVHCATGIRSSVAAALLERHGFDVALVNDDFAHWSEAHPQVVDAEVA